MGRMLELLKRMTEIGGSSGDEGDIREFIKMKVVSRADEVNIDRMGNLIAIKKGVSSHKKVMLCAHMDEVGFIITGIDDNGMLKFKTVGGMDPRIFPSKKVRVGKDALPGVLGIKAIHLQEPEERKKAVKVKQMYIDIGAGTRDEAERVVNKGDYAVFDSEFVTFGENRVKGKALDDRAGCAILMEMLSERYDFDLYACFTVQEEVGLRGAEVAAYHIEPEIALVVETTTCSDVPGIEDHMHITRMGRGPAVSIADRSSYSSKEMVSELLKTARESGIPVQVKEGITGANDAGRIHLSRDGVKTAVVSVPCRYIHSPCSVMDMNDFNNTIRLVKEFLKGCEAK